MEAEAFGWIRFRSIFFVPDDGVAGLGEVDADLVAAAGAEGEFDEGSRLGAGDDAVVGDGVAGGLGGAWGGVDLVGV